MLWAMLAAFVTNPLIRSIVAAIITSIGYCLCLLYISKIRPQNDREVLDDYAGSAYGGVINDVKFAWKRETPYIYVICIICAACFVLTVLNSIWFERAVISFPTLFFFPIIIVSAAFKIKIIGYVVNTLFVVCAYFLTVLLYRRQQYKKWQH